MRRLPHIDSVIQHIHEKTAALKVEEPAEKVASSEFVVPVAGELHKVAQQLRESDPTAITYADVQAFAMQLKESAQ